MEDQLTPQAREAIRSFVWRLAIIPGFLATALAAIAGFSLSHWVKTLETETRLAAYEERLQLQEKHQDRYLERISAIIENSSGLAVEAERVRDDIMNAQYEIDNINKILVDFGVSEALQGELEKIRERIIDDSEFRNGIAQTIGMDVIAAVHSIEKLLTNSIQAGVTRCNRVYVTTGNAHLFPDGEERVRALADIQFNQPFDEAPHILLSQQQFEIGTTSGNFIEFAIFPEKVSRDGFSINVVGEDDTIFADCAISWIAIDKRLGTFQNIEGINYTGWVD